MKPGEQYFLWSAIISDKNSTTEETQEVLKSVNTDIREQGVDSALFFAHFYPYIFPKNEETDRHHFFGKMLRNSDMNKKQSSFTKKQVVEFASWLEAKASTVENLTLPYATCKRVCSKEVGQCMIDVLSFGGGYKELSRFVSPLETLISYDQYIISDRAQNSLLRRLKWQSLKSSQMAKGSFSRCLSNLLNHKPINY